MAMERSDEISEYRDLMIEMSGSVLSSHRVSRDLARENDERTSNH